MCNNTASRCRVLFMFVTHPPPRALTTLSVYLPQLKPNFSLRRTARLGFEALCACYCFLPELRFKGLLARLQMPVRQ